MSIPAVICSSYFRVAGKLELPMVYVLYAINAAMVVAILYAFIE
jgi:hypothetical protein